MLSRLRLTLPHYYDFGADRSLVGDDLVRPEAWDALRTQSEGDFAMPRTREELDRLADQRDEIGSRARALHALFEDRAVATVASYGAGAGFLESSLERLRGPGGVTLTEYAPATVARLRELFGDANVRRHDLLEDPPLDADVHLFHRIDTEFTNAQWRAIFRGFSGEHVVVVTAAATLSDLVRELLVRVRARNATRAGWMRTRSALEALWRSTHAATPHRFHDLDGWELVPLPGGR